VRPNVKEYMINIAFATSERATCVRRKVGCVLTDINNHILSTGYNGVPKGVTHCIDRPCIAASSSSGTNLEGCKAIHAEVNAVAHCHDIQSVYAAYCTTLPCIHCIKLLLATNCQVIYYNQEYPHSLAKELWIDSGRELEQI